MWWKLKFGEGSYQFSVCISLIWKTNKERLFSVLQSIGKGSISTYAVSLVLLHCCYLQLCVWRGMLFLWSLKAIAAVPFILVTCIVPVLFFQKQVKNPENKEVQINLVIFKFCVACLLFRLSFSIVDVYLDVHSICTSFIWWVCLGNAHDHYAKGKNFLEWHFFIRPGM